jgi:hypothetical protein
MCTDVVAWLPNGKTFAIFDRKRFEVEVMPLFLESNAKYPSFVRRLLRWNFKQANDGATCLFANPFFQRGSPRLLKQLRSKESKMGQLEQRLMQQSALLQRSNMEPQPPAAPMPVSALVAARDSVEYERRSALCRLQELDMLSSRLASISQPNNLATPSAANYPANTMGRPTMPVGYNQQGPCTNRDVKNILSSGFFAPTQRRDLPIITDSFSENSVKHVPSMGFFQAGLASKMFDQRRLEFMTNERALKFGFGATNEARARAQSRDMQHETIARLNKWMGAGYHGGRDSS